MNKEAKEDFFGTWLIRTGQVVHSGRSLGKDDNIDSAFRLSKFLTRIEQQHRSKVLDTSQC